jgi:rRNA maturation endonuclease Nob1
VPFPFSIIAIIAVFLTINYYIRKRQLRQMGLGSAGGFSSFFGQRGSVNYYCSNCGTKHNQKSCPNCGSKLKRVGFEE